MSRGRILVIRGGAIGDFILTLPALAALRKGFPQTQLDVLGYPHIASLAKLAGYANDVRSIDARPLAGFFARQGELDKALCDYFASFNIIVSFLYDPDEIFRANIARCAKAQFIAGPYRPSETESVHATDALLKPLERLAIFGADPVPHIRLSAELVRIPNLLAVHPGSGSEKKNWPEEQWTRLLQQIAAETDWRVLLIGGEAEEARLQRLSSLIPVERLAVAFGKPLPELAERLAQASFFLGHDSGITHLAAALDLRGIALWADSNEAVWRPRSARFQVLKTAGGLAALPVAEVLQRLRSGAA